MTKVICSHGFGVTADSRGMFPELAEHMPDDEFEMFDYNQILPTGDILVASLHDQAKTLQAVIDKHSDNDAVLLCHSQGCVVAGLVDLAYISKVILLAPPVKMSIQRVIDKMRHRPGSVIDLKGTSTLPRSDGTITRLPKEYVQSLGSIHPMQLYQKIADKVPTLIVRATNDEIIGLTNVTEVHHAVHVDIAADHNFRGDSRVQLATQLKSFING